MSSFEQWCLTYPAAAAALVAMLNEQAAPPPNSSGRSEAWSQQAARLDVAKQGAYSFRNNVGATPAKCPSCGARRQPVRYGLANDSAKLNARIKSSDLILAIPRRIEPADVGRTFAQFGSVECKPPGWTYSGNEHEQGQAAWLALIRRIGGFAIFSTGTVKL